MLSQFDCEDPLESDLANFDYNFDVNVTKQAVTLVDSAPWSSIEEWISNGESPQLSSSPVLPCVIKPLDCELKPLPPDLSIELLVPIKVNRNFFPSHGDNIIEEMIVDNSRVGNDGIEWDFVFRIDLSPSTRKFCLKTLIFKHSFP
ncbi:hypothetical protein RHGRI_014039 [Rhododendron griersonianum]|uniref:Uncharacterized protein n=1 Tax=Rhododendron griersonianum TaxID=479676 RepID=A0AAV6K7W4_9ERIC|nr:hypothetical protein RHGRI_014039 [Rhododendron griersonianum]